MLVSSAILTGYVSPLLRTPPSRPQPSAATIPWKRIARPRQRPNRPRGSAAREGPGGGGGHPLLRPPRCDGRRLPLGRRTRHAPLRPQCCLGLHRPRRRPRRPASLAAGFLSAAILSGRYAGPVRLLVAPQEFKGSLTAAAAAEAIAAGVRQARPAWELDLLPLSDGGPGLLDAIGQALACETRTVPAHDPLGRPVTTRYLVTREATAVVEAAQANGLFRLAGGERDALTADTAGVGEIILAALADRPRRLVVGVGGSATTDGGAGMARALGARLNDADGHALPPGGAALARLASVVWRRPPSLGGVAVSVATDVRSPLLGPTGAARLFGPQKGATPADVDALEAALAHYARVVRRDLGVDLTTVEGGGAAGGLAAGMVAFLGAKVESGFDLVARATGLQAHLGRAQLVVTGEGRFDSQSLQGKTTGRLLELAAAQGKHFVVLAGSGEPVAGVALHTLSEVEPDERRRQSAAAESLAALAARWAATVEDQPV
ncbi:MAG: glycerate kinase [Dehalococcoidia bacterium]|nr:glycerate kinase [Dehalococcoidia bacterium]